MTIEERRERDRAARRQLIVTTARRIAEAEGWDAVTTRRLSAEIEYSQPVLYKHFSNMEAIAQRVAVEGFRELAESLRDATVGATEPEHALRRIAHAYIDFAVANPAVYDAMFTRATTLHFAAADTPTEVSAAFVELRDVVTAVADTADADTATETLWAALHGLATLGRSGRLRDGHQSERVDFLVKQFVAAPTPANP
ncbi:TetR/AcrR family transcriptional regulator [Mycolicibacterium moriokaense]|nr:TetR/AcrR family transcriptional regulator [Mycolicibacterium moriokaense]